MRPSVWRRALCRLLGHRWLEGSDLPFISFLACRRCGVWRRYQRSA